MELWELELDTCHTVTSPQVSGQLFCNKMVSHFPSRVCLRKEPLRMLGSEMSPVLNRCLLPGESAQ